MLGSTLTAGADRLRAAAWPLAQATVAAGVAVLVASNLLGHPYPFFAAVAAFVCLGLADDRRLRRVAEVAVGVTLGVALGEVFALTVGRGAWQIAVALAVAVAVTLVVQGGQLAVTQSGVQAAVVVGLPPAAGDPLGRWQDALIGSGVAVAVAVLLPADPRRSPRERLVAVVRELTGVLESLADALRRGDAAAAHRTLDRARGTQPLADAASSAVRGAREVTVISPARRRHADEVARLDRAVSGVDRALRNGRVVARRAVSTLEDGRPRPEVADRVTALAEAARILRWDLAEGGDTAPSRTALTAASATLDPAGVPAGDRGGAAVVVLLRPLAVDLLEAAGLPHDEARAALPPTLLG